MPPMPPCSLSWLLSYKFPAPRSPSCPARKAARSACWSAQPPLNTSSSGSRALCGGLTRKMAMIRVAYQSSLCLGRQAVMPIYEYTCKQCGNFEIIQRITEAPLKKCPTCGSRVAKLISRSAFHLKGSGWYATDYSKNGASPSKTDDSKSTTSETKTSETKTSETKENSSSGTSSASSSAPTSTTKESSVAS